MGRIVYADVGEGTKFEGVGPHVCQQHTDAEPGNDNG